MLFLECSFLECKNILLVIMKNNTHHLAIKFGKTLRNLRLQANLSQEEFAHLCKIHRTYIGSIERGEKNITLEMANRVATVLGTSLSAMIALAEDIHDE
ncbi:MAG: helix-turn-helix transcriptional regulator [Phototrophicales bacterium]|nr:helix-turn-helix transcriptional regulator [Phototrophicales bacterium]